MSAGRAVQFPVQHAPEMVVVSRPPWSAEVSAATSEGRARCVRTRSNPVVAPRAPVALPLVGTTAARAIPAPADGCAPQHRWPGRRPRLCTRRLLFHLRQGPFEQNHVGRSMHSRLHPCPSRSTASLLFYSIAPTPRILSSTPRKRNVVPPSKPSEAVATHPPLRLSHPCLN
jgi:hypothetical protein